MIFRLLLWCALASLAVTAPAQRTTDLRIDRPWLGLPQVPVTLNNRVEANFIVDTAASETIMTDAVIARLRLRPTGEPAELSGATGSSSLAHYRLDSLQLGNRRYRQLGAYSFPPLAAPVETDGLLGTDVLRRHVVELDMPRGRMRLHGRRIDFLQFEGEGVWDAVPVLQRRDGFLIVNVRIGRLRIPALIDTGAVQNFVNEEAARQLGLRFVPDSASRTGITGASGHVQTMNQLELSGFSVGNTDFGPSRLGVTDLAIFETLGMAGRPAMILSAEVLADRRVILDYPRSRLLIERQD